MSIPLGVVMNPLSRNPLVTKAAGELGADTRSLDALKREAGRDPRSAVKMAAQQFEALFMQMVLKSMRDATPKSGMFESAAGEMATGMLDQQLATKVAASGTGLADMIARQLTRHIRKTPEGEAGTTQSPAQAASHAAAAAPRTSLQATPHSAAAAATAPSQATPLLAVAAGAQARAADASATPAASANTRQRDFVTRMWDHALAAERATGIPAKFVIGQAALESGWGANEIRDASGLPTHNLFGIKAGSNWQGRTVDALTTEVENGVARKVVEKFRAYNNYSEAFRDWAQLMAGNPRYGQVLAQGRDIRGFAFGLQRAGYATDPDYGAKLARVIQTTLALRGSA